VSHPDQQIDGTFRCQFDSTVHADLLGLHDHLKRFRVSREKYYTLYHPRTDRLNGQPLPFKDYQQYLTQDFATKVTLRQWLAKHPKEGLEWSKAWLSRRKEEKGLLYAPSQAELRTLQCPSMPYYETMAANEGGYYGVTKVLGYADRYTSAPLTFFPLFSDAVIIQDSREQHPIILPRKTRSEALSVGDYALSAPYDQGIRIERKSLGDFCGTMSERKIARKGGRKGTGATEDSSFQRFDRELARAQEQNLYVVMLVEASIADAQRFDYLPQTQWVKAKPSHIFHNWRTLLARYPLTFQCVFCDGRLEMSRIIPKVFELGDQVRTADLQWHLEEGRL
jgi:hypothetical protein